MMKSDYLVSLVMQCQGFIWPRDPFALGMFEFTKRPDPMPGCEEALAESLREFGLTPDHLVRVQTYFIGSGRHEAIRAARLYAREAASLMSHLSMGSLSASHVQDAGYTFDIRRSHARPILPTDLQPKNPMGVVAKIDELATHPDLVLNTLLSVNPEHHGELGRAVRRSTHWSDLARHAQDFGERLMLRWMCCETLARVSEDEDISPKLLSALGFVHGKYGQGLPENERSELAALPGFRDWRRRLVPLFDKAREMRNSIVHAGFREIDLRGKLSDDDWMLLNRAMSMVIPRLQALSFNALQLGLKTVDAMWDQFGRCVLLYRVISIARELEGTIIFSLSQPRSQLDDA